MTPTDPLTRFSDIVYGLYKQTYIGKPGVEPQSGVYHLGVALAALLEREPEGEVYSRFEALEEFANMLRLGMEAERYVDLRSPERGKERNMNYVRALVDKLNSVSANSNAQTFNTVNQPAVDIERLQALADHLSVHGENPVVAQGDLDEIVGQIDQLTDFVIASSLDERLKGVLIRTLGILRMEMKRVNIVGPDNVIDSLDRLLGQSVRAAIASGSPEQREAGTVVFTRAAAVSENIGKLIDVGQKIYPLLMTGARTFGILP